MRFRAIWFQGMFLKRSTLFMEGKANLTSLVLVAKRMARFGKSFWQRAFMLEDSCRACSRFDVNYQSMCPEKGAFVLVVTHMG